MVCPLSYSSRQHRAATKKYFVYGLDNTQTTISYDIEHAIVKVCEREIQCVRQVEKFK